MTTVRDILEAYRVPEPLIFTFRKGVLRLGTEVIPLEWAESFRPSMRVALSLLLWFFKGENDAERRAFALHYQLGRRLTVGEDWSMTQSDLADAVTEILISRAPACTVVVLSAERRDQLRQLCAMGSAS